MADRAALLADVEKLEAIHEKNRLAYREARALAEGHAKVAQELSDVASASANELAAAKHALRSFDKRQGPTVTGSGALAADSAAVKKG